MSRYFAYVLPLYKHLVGGSPIGVRSCPLVNGLEDSWPMSRRCLEPRWFVEDPASLARDNR